MRDVARDPAALERLRVQRGRLAERMRPPWWYLSGITILWALVFACPFSSRFLPQGVPIWPIMAAAVVVACLLQWGLARATGIKVGFRNLRYPASGRPARIAVFVVWFAASETEFFLIRRGLLAAAIRRRGPRGRGGGGPPAGPAARDPPGVASLRRAA
jgi:hypothetical protein